MMLRSIRALYTVRWFILMLGCNLAMAEDITGILMVEISGLKDLSGNVYIAVYDSDSTWLSEDMVLNQKVVIADALEGDLVRTELLLPLGNYALSVFYDQDGDGKLKTNFIGMPKEPIALSNNAVAKFGPPRYDDAVFSLGVQPLIQNLSIKAL